MKELTRIDKAIHGLRYLPRVWAALGYLVSIIAVLVLFFSRNFEALRMDFLGGLLPNFESHISNFSLSYIGYSTLGYMGLMMGMRMWHLLVIGAMVVLINLGVEAFWPWTNIRDAVDAYYGSAGAVAAGLFLISMKIFGLKPNPQQAKPGTSR